MTEHWIIPCSVKKFDVVDYFTSHETIVWRRISAVQEGDIAYIYVGSPFSEVRYKCEVISDNVDEKVLSKNTYALREDRPRSRYMQLKLIKEYSEGQYSLANLRKHGLNQTQTQARTDRKLQLYFDATDKE